MDVAPHLNFLTALTATLVDITLLTRNQEKAFIVFATAPKVARPKRAGVRKRMIVARALQRASG